MSRKREAEAEHAHVGSGRVGLAIVDVQTLHRGHVGLLTELRMTCDVAIVGIGSVRQSGTEGHPFTFDQRKAMIEGVFGRGAFRFVPLDDIDARDDRRAWYAYVRQKILQTGLPDPTDYFGGSRIDSQWYEDAFASYGENATTGGHVLVFRNEETGRRLHVVDRARSGVPSGREIRLLVEMRDPEWKRYVPERLHSFVEHEYPPSLRQPLPPSVLTGLIRERGENLRLFQAGDGRADEMVPTFANLRDARHRKEGTISALDWLLSLVPGRYPVGTRMKDEAGEIVELKDDGRWRPVAGPDEKAEYARRQKQIRAES